MSWGQPQQQQWGAPQAQGQWGAPQAQAQGQWGAPQGGFGAPQGGFGAPQGGFGAPQGGFGGPTGGYGAPQGGPTIDLTIVNITIGAPKGQMPASMSPMDAINDFSEFMKNVYQLSRAKFVTRAKMEVLDDFPLPEFDPLRPNTSPLSIASMLAQTLAITSAAGRDLQVQPQDRSLAKILYIIALLAAGADLNSNQLRALMHSTDKNFVGVLNTLFESKPHRWGFGNLPILQAIFNELKMDVNISQLSTQVDAKKMFG